jgi:hypothetical protein
MNPSNRLLKASNLTNQRPEFLESYIRIFDSFDSSFIQKIRKIQLQLPALSATWNCGGGRSTSQVPRKRLSDHPGGASVTREINNPHSGRFVRETSCTVPIPRTPPPIVPCISSRKMSRAAALAANDGDRRFRRQQPVSCEFCRHKKLKCSRGSPCSNCVSRRLRCVPLVPGKSGL